MASLPESLLNFRGQLLAEMVAQGHEVLACAPGENPTVREGLRQLGVSYQPIRLARTGLNPLRDVTCIFDLIGVFRTFRPELVIGYTIKPVIYGSLAARITGVREMYSIITGLGYVFMGHTLRRKLIRRFVCLLYRMAIKANRAVFFQNPDDLALFRELGLVGSDTRTVLINGSGVDLVRFPVAAPLPCPPVYLLIARLLRDKGIVEYVEAARLLKRRYPAAEFRLLGPFDDNPSAIERDRVFAWHDSGVIVYLGETDDVRPFIAAAGVYVLPSYREGTPRSVLEAMAMGRPIVTTDVPGCRETVIDGENGFLVKVQDAEALACAMERFILQPELIISMGRRSREIAEDKYDVNKVNAVIMNTMGLDDEKIV